MKAIDQNGLLRLPSRIFAATFEVLDDDPPEYGLLEDCWHILIDLIAVADTIELLDDGPAFMVELTPETKKLRGELLAAFGHSLQPRRQYRSRWQWLCYPKVRLGSVVTQRGHWTRTGRTAKRPVTLT